MKSARWSAAIVGCGRIAGIADRPTSDGRVGTHGQAYFRHSGFSLEAIVEPDEVRRQRFSEVWRVAGAYASLDALLDAGSIDVVSVCSPTAAHQPQTCRLLDADRVRAIVIEKPVCDRHDEFMALCERARRRPEVAVLVNHTRRFDPAHRQAAAIVANGTLGRFVSGRCDYYGGWRHNGSHLVDTVRMMLGELSVIRASRGASGQCGDPCLDVTLETDTGVIEVAGFDEAKHYQLFEMDLRFERGRLLLRNFGEEIVIERVRTNEVGERYLDADPASPLTGLQSPLLHLLNAVDECLSGRGTAAETGASLADAAETMRVVWEAEARV